MKHYIVTNRLVVRDADGVERINSNGKEQAQDELRFAEFDTLTNNYRVIPEPDSGLAIDAVQFNYVIAPDGSLQDEAGNQVSLDTVHGSVYVFTEIYKSIRDGSGDVLFFIHGFNTDFDSSIRTLISLDQQYAQNGLIKHIVLFSWPAMSSLLEYRDDARDAELSGYGLARFYRKMQTFQRDFFRIVDGSPRNKPCKSKIHLMCHSLGALVLESMLSQLISERLPITVMLDKVFMMAADVEWTALEKPKPLYEIVDLCVSAFVYYHRGDIALQVSETTKNPFNRLGKYGPKNKNLIPDDVYMIDTSNVSSFGELINHGYYLSEQVVVDDILQTVRTSAGFERERRI